MPLGSLAELETVIRSSWSEQTCDPVDQADWSRQGVHYWNRLGEGVELDLTRERFTPGEVVEAPQTVPRPPDTSVGRLASQYQALAIAVRAALR
jgi:hypothetical protein